jgi:hypothetical protein
MQLSPKHFKAVGIKVVDRVLNAGLGFTVSAFNQELNRRNLQRNESSGQWFTHEESAVAEALGKTIIPSDEESPGFDEVCVLGPSAVSSLDRMVKNCVNRQYFYSRGLLSFDIWASQVHGRRFAELSVEQQTNLFRAAQEISDRWKAKPSLITKLWRRFGAPFAEVRKGTFYAALLYPMIRDDSIRIFYTSRVSWIWLGYDGPPMEKGYVSLTEPRDAAGRLGLASEKTLWR